MYRLTFVSFVSFVVRLTRSRHPVLTITAVAGAVFVLYAFALGRMPVYLCDAEVLFALNAHSVATTARDVNGRLLPLYFQVYANMWFQPIIVYLTALFLTVLPVAEWTVRLPSVAVGVLDVVLMYAIAKRLFTRGRWALFAAVALALTPAHFIHSRLAMDYLYPVPFVTAWLLGMLIFLERRRQWILFAVTSVLGLGCYSYIASLVMMPVYLALTLFAVSKTEARPWRLYVIAIAGFVWPVVAIVPWVIHHPEALKATAGRYELAERPGSGTVTRPAALPPPVVRSSGSTSTILQDLRQTARFSGLTGRISLYWYFFDPSYLFLTGGYANVINSTRHVGVFLLPFAVLIPIGLYRLVVRHAVIDVILLIGFLTAPVAACLVVPEPYAIDRELELLPFAVLIATSGLVQLSTSPLKTSRLVAGCLLALIPLHFAFFCFDYFGDYRLRSAFWFEGNRRGAIEDAVARDARERVPAIYLNTDIPYIDAYWKLYLIKLRREDLLPRTVYVDAASLDPQAMPPRSLLVTLRDDRAARALIDAGKLREVAAIPEPADPPWFAVLQR